MKNLTLIGAMVSAQLMLSQNIPAQNRPFPESDVSQIYSAGSIIYNQAAIVLQPGLYIVGDDNNTIAGTHFLLVDQYFNDPSKLVGIMISQNSVNRGTQTAAKMFMGRPIKGRNSIMLSPLAIDMYGNIGVDSEVSRNSPVMEISRDTTQGRQRYPLFIQGHNGALNGQVLGMRAAAPDKRPTWRGWPSSGIFEGESSNAKLVINGNTMAIHDGSRMDRRFAMVPLNGDLGKFAGLQDSSFDTMAEMDVSSSQFRKLTFFLTGLCDQEIFVIASPTNRVGDYNIEIFSPKRRTFMDIFFPGKVSY